MLEVAERDAHEDGEGETGRLAPLPKRVDEDLPTRPPIEVVQQLLERTAALLSTLVHDEAGLEEDEHEERLRIESEKAQRRQAAEQALEELAALGAHAEEIAAKKDKLPVLQQAMQRKAPPAAGLDFLAIRAELLEEIKAARGITGAIRLPRIGELLVELGAAVEQMVDDAEHYTERRLSAAREEKAAETKEARASFDIGLMVLNRDLVTLDQALPAASRPWGSPGWAAWQPNLDESTTRAVIRLGGLHDRRLEPEIPLLWEFPSAKGLYLEAGQHRDAAVAAVQSITLRLLAGLPPGALRVGVIDPRGLGESAAPLMGLAEFGDAVLTGSVATTPDAIEIMLAETTRHIERVIQHYLRGRFTTLAEANDAAGEIVEPYRLLCVFDHPHGLSEQATAQLATIAATGPACGVFPIITKDAQPSGAFAGAWGAPKLEGLEIWRCDAQGFFLEVPNAGRWTVRFDVPPAARAAGSEPGDAGEPDEADVVLDTGVEIGPVVEVGPVDPDLLDRLLGAVGGAALARREQSVSPARLFHLFSASARRGRRGPPIEAPIDPERAETWWACSSATGVGAPIGRSGAEPAIVWMDASQPGLVIAGRPGSGRSNAVTALVLGMSMIYAPDELELRLIGMGTSSDLARFAEHDLPHATVIATGADRGFVESVLRDLQAETDRRYGLLRDTVGERAGLAAYRHETGARLPRIVCVVDHYGELLDRAAAPDTAVGLERLVRMGGPVGIHLVLVTPTSDARALDAPVTRQLKPRLLLRMDDHAATSLAGEAAEQVGESTLPGDATLLAGPDDTAGAAHLRTVMIEPVELELSLRDARRRADAEQMVRRPRCVAGDRAARLEQRDLRALIGDESKRALRRMPRLLLGEPLELGDPVEVLLRRQEGANLLVVSSDAEQGQGLLVSALTSAAFVHGPNLATMALDFMPMESGFTESLQILGNGPWTVQVARRRSLAKVLDVIHRVVQDRRSSGDNKGKAVFFVLNGLSRARELEVDADGQPVGDERALLGVLGEILRDGPEVGVHTLAWGDSVATLRRRLPPSTIREFAVRVAGPMAADDGLGFVDTDATAQLRPNQAVLYDEDSGRMARFVPYAMPARDWLLRAVGDAAEPTQADRSAS